MVSTEAQAENGRVESPEGGEVVGVPSLGETIGGLAAAFGHRRTVAREAAKLGGELVRVALGRSEVAPGKSDRRFSDPAWSGNPLFSRIERGYLATQQAVSNVVGELGEGAQDSRRAEQARFATTILTSALAPTNYFATNPAAIKRAFDTGGKSLVRGVRNFVGDLRNNGGMPSMVERDAFEVGKDLALSPGAVVQRDEVGELIQYQPTTEQVYQRPLVIIPPPIGRFYFLDLRPGRSFIEYATSQGIQVFLLSWRNPTADEGELGPRHLRHPGARRHRRRPRDLRQPRRQRDGLLRGRHHHHHPAQPPRRDRRRPGAQHVVRGHAARLHRARPDHRVPSPEPAAVRESPFPPLGHHHQQADGRRVHLDAPRRPGLQLLGQQLPHGRQAAGVRHPGLERRRHQPPRRSALRVPRHLRGQPAHQARRPVRARQPDAARRDQGADVRHRRGRRPPHAVAGLLPHHPAARRRFHVRAELLRAHRQPGQPARQPEGALLDRRRHPGPIRRSGSPRRPSTRAAGGEPGPSGSSPTAASKKKAPRTSATRPTRSSTPHPAATCTAEACRSSRSSGTGRRRSAPPTTTRCPPPGGSSPPPSGRSAGRRGLRDPEVVAGTLRPPAAHGEPAWKRPVRGAVWHRQARGTSSTTSRCCAVTSNRRASNPCSTTRARSSSSSTRRFRRGARTAGGRPSPPTHWPPCTTSPTGCRRGATRWSSAPAG